MNDEGWLGADDPEDDDPGEDARADADLEVAGIVAAFEALIPLAPGDALLARPAVEAVARAVRDASGPEDPTPGMMTVPALVEDPLARAQLADASPGAREALGDLEMLLVRVPQAARAAAAERIRRAVRDADTRLARDPGRWRDLSP